MERFTPQHIDIHSITPAIAGLSLQMLDHLPSAVLLIDSGYKVRYANQTALDLLNLEPADACDGRACADVLASRSSSTFWGITHAFEQHAAVAYEAEIPGDHPVRITATPLKDKLGQVAHVMLAIEDQIGRTNRREAMDSLKRELAKGNLDTRINTRRQHGEERRELDDINDLLDTALEPVNELVKRLKQLADGDLSVSSHHATAKHFAGFLEVGRLRDSLTTTFETLLRLAVELDVGARLMERTAKATQTQLSDSSKMQEDVDEVMRRMLDSVNRSHATSRDSLLTSMQTQRALNRMHAPFEELKRALESLTSMEDQMRDALDRVEKLEPRLRTWMTQLATPQADDASGIRDLDSMLRTTQEVARSMRDIKRILLTSVCSSSNTREAMTNMEQQIGQLTDRFGIMDQALDELRAEAKQQQRDANKLSVFQQNHRKHTQRHQSRIQHLLELSASLSNLSHQVTASLDGYHRWNRSLAVNWPAARDDRSSGLQDMLHRLQEEAEHEEPATASGIAGETKDADAFLDSLRSLLDDDDTDRDED